MMVSSQYRTFMIDAAGTLPVYGPLSVRASAFIDNMMAVSASSIERQCINSVRGFRAIKACIDGQLSRFHRGGLLKHNIRIL